MAKHSENIHKRKDGRYEGRYIKARTDEGKAVWGYVYGGSYTAVKETLTRKKAESGFYSLAGQDPTLEQLALLWLNSVYCGVKLYTSAPYRYTLQHYLFPGFRGVHVKALNEHTLEQGLLQIIAPPDGSRRPLGSSTAKECLTLLRRICRYASHLRLMRPVEIEVRLPQPPAKKEKTLTRAEQQAVLAYVWQAPTARKAGLLLMMQMGLRIGEVCGLQWSDFNWQTATLSIRRTVRRIPCGGKTQLVIQTPKTRTSERELPIPRPLVPLLKRLRGKAGAGAWFLSGREDKPVEPRCYRKSIHSYLRQARVADVHPHLLRHTFATTCLQAGCDLQTLSELMGHADSSITLQRYVHTDMTRKQQEINRVFAPLCRTDQGSMSRIAGV